MFRLALALCLLASPALASQCIQLSQNETPTVWRAATPGAAGAARAAHRPSSLRR